MQTGYRADWGYDASDHWEYVQWLVQHRSLPLPDQLLEAQHPVLFYLLAAVLTHLGVVRQRVVWLPVVLGILRLVIIWCGLEWYLPRYRWARVSTLALTAVLPVSVHVDGMLYPEPLSGMLVAAILLLIPLVFDTAGRHRWWKASAVGFLLGLEMLTKVSGLVCIAAIGLTAMCHLLFSRRDTWEMRVVDLAPWSAAIGLCVAISGWFYARNVVHYHRPFVTSFELSQQWAVTESSGVALLDRRTLGFVFGWDNSIYALPYWPSASQQPSRFFPVALASTFVDYWNYSFSGLSPSFPSDVHANGRPLTPHLLAMSRASVMGGTIILVAALAAGYACMRRAFRSRDWGPFCLLLVPAVTIAGGLFFSVKYPLDGMGVTKSAYLQFGAPPMYAMFGVALEWARRHWPRWPIAAAMVIGLGLVASYTVYCRVVIPFVVEGHAARAVAMRALSGRSHRASTFGSARPSPAGPDLGTSEPQLTVSPMM